MNLINTLFFTICFLLMFTLQVNAQTTVGASSTTGSTTVETVGSGSAVEETTRAPAKALNPYPLMTQTIQAVKNFIFDINAKIATATKGIFMATIGVYSCVVGIRYFATSQINPVQQLTIILGLVLANALVYGNGFEKYVYQPTVGVTMDLSAFVLNSASGGKISRDGSSIEQALTTVTDQISQIYTISDRLTDQAEEAGITDIGTKLYSFFLLMILTLIYTALIVIFFTIYTIGLVGMHFILFFFPWAMLIGAFPFGRGVLINWFKTIVSFGLVPVFASVAMGITIYTLNTVAPAIASSMQGATSVDITSKVYQQAVIIGLFSIFFHLKASEFAQTLTGSQVTNFGQFFGTMMGVGVAGYQAANKGYTLAGGAAGISKTAFSKGMNMSRAVNSYLHSGK